MIDWLTYQHLCLHAWKTSSRLKLNRAQIRTPLEFGLQQGAHWSVGEASFFDRDGFISLGLGSCFQVGNHTRFARGWDVRMYLCRELPVIGIGDDCRVEKGVSLSTFGDAQLHIGKGCFIGQGTILAAHRCVSVGEETAIAEYVSIRDHDHLPAQGPIHLSPMSVAPISIGRRVWIGAKATITAGVSIGDGAVIGANAVVTRDVPAGERVGGVPARPLPRRFSQV